MKNAIIYERENILSENLQRIRKREKVVIPLFFFIFTVILATLNVYFRGMDNPYWVLVIYAVAVIIPLYIRMESGRAEGRIPKIIYYSNAGLRWTTSNNKEIFIPWNDVIKVSPIGDYGKIMGYGNGKVSDYAIYFKRPFMGFKIVSTEAVSAEVGQKIGEYLREFREKGSVGGGNGR